MAMTFFTAALPMIAYLSVNSLIAMFKFIMLMQIDDETSGNSNPNGSSTLGGIMSPKQWRGLAKLLKNLCLSFSLYFLSMELDLYVIAVD